MKYQLLRFSLLSMFAMLFGGFSFAAIAGDPQSTDEDKLYTWDFTKSDSPCTLAGGGDNVVKDYPSAEDASVTLGVNATGGKFNPRGSDVQVNAPTKINVPVKNGGDVITIYNYRNGSNGVTYTIGAETKTASDVTFEYTVSKTEAKQQSVEISVTGSGYMDKITVLQKKAEAAGGESYDNVAGSITWAVGNEETPAIDATIANGLSATSFSAGSDLTVTAATYLSQSMVAYKPNTSNAGNAEADMIEYRIKPKAGLTFKPTSISYYAVKDGTDNATYTWSYTLDGAESAITQVTKDNIVRNNNTSGTPSLEHTETFSVDPCTEFTFRIYVSGFANNKKLGIGNVVINGIINGTVQDVATYTLGAAASPAEGGTVTKYPNAEEYEAGTEVTMTAKEEFGYDFVNWTNGAGEEVSKDAQFKYTVNSNETLTANFQAVDTYELALTVDGTNDYMVVVSPAPTVVDNKWMYEAGTQVKLTANQYEGLVTFNNWSDNTTESELTVTMTENKQITASYSEADIIAGWDFYKAGNNGRIADFASAENEADALNLVKSDDGTTSGWLDKSTLGGGGYESFKGAAVNWRSEVGTHHWQTKVNAEAFSDITVQFQMLYNYNSYKTYNVEYSLDGTEWTKFGSVTMTGAKAVATFKGQLPAAANNQSVLHIRMISDKESGVVGTEGNDGNALAMFFITGSPKLADDPVAPTLVSSVPENNATGASATGKIVLTFDKKVKVAEGTTATIGTMELTPTVSGKTISFPYKGLDYSTPYLFTLPANTVSNLTGATIAESITIQFTTMDRPTVEKGAYDAIVSNVEGLLAAINAAESRSDKNVRFRIFIKNGEYTLPTSGTKHVRHTNGKSGSEEVVYCDENIPECITFLKSGNISFIGESRDGVIITNGIDKTATFAGTYGQTSKYDGIGNSDVFQLSGSGYFFQDLTIETGMDDATGRGLAIHDKAKKTIYKNVGLRGYQDTWTSNNDNGLYYFEGGYVRGRTDYLCGKGDAYFNGVELRQVGKGGYAIVPSKPANIGWGFYDCTFNGDTDYQSYTLGRPWGQGTPTAYLINTKMNVVPDAIGWNEMSGGWPARFAEYNSTTSTGSQVDLSGRKTVFAGSHTNDPVLTAEEAATYSDMDKMFGDWNPTLLTEQAPAVTDVELSGTTLSWTGNNYSLLYAVCYGGNVVDFTTETSYDIASAESTPRRAGATWSVRAANEMGGLNDAVEATNATAIKTIQTPVQFDGAVYNMQGVRVSKAQKGLYIMNGKKVVVK